MFTIINFLLFRVVVVLAGANLRLNDREYSREAAHTHPLTKESSMRYAWFGLAAISLFIGSSVLAEGTDTPVIDQRQANQEKRIDQGIASGQLTEREANRLNKQQKHINKMEDHAKSDGVVTKKERARIHAAQDRASRNIARQKHDKQQK